MSFRSPLNIYVVWHPNFTDGGDIANTIFSTFNRKVTEPLSRGIGIPVYYRSSGENNLPLEIDFNEAEYSIVVFLIDNVLTISTEWHSYINKCLASTNEKVLILPVAIDNGAFNIPVEFGKLNFIRLFNKPAEEKEQYLLLSLTHEFCRHLFESDRNLPSSNISLSFAPMKVFLSHSKHDEGKRGEKLAMAIRDHISSDLSMKTFFDINDIAPGYDFEKEIYGNIERMIFLCILTDTYAKREYCRKEVLYAKSQNRPILVINALDKGEDRSFPYMSNVPTIRITVDMTASAIIPTTEVEYILLKILLEALRFQFHTIFIKHILSMFPQSSSLNIEAHPYTPELLSLNNIAHKGINTILYPDPPLGDEERKLLNLINDRFGFTYEYITPTLLPLKYL